MKIGQYFVKHLVTEQGHGIKATEDTKLVLHYEYTHSIIEILKQIKSMNTLSDIIKGKNNSNYTTIPSVKVQDFEDADVSDEGNSTDI